MNLRAEWQSFSPSTRKKIVWVLVGLVVALVLVGVCVSRSNKQGVAREPRARESSLESPLGVDSRPLHKQRYMDMAQDVNDLKKKFDAIAPEARPGFSAGKPPSPPSPSVPEPAPSIPLPEPVPSPPVRSYPQQGMAPNAIPPVPSGPAVELPREEFVGSIEQERGAPEVNAGSEGKKKESRIYLPPSFMAATLLSGLDAPAIDMGKGSPVPVLVRIRDLAFLPNSVKADLKGCFVIADGHGSLSDERAHLRLVNLSCLSRKGQAVVDQKIKGFVVDEDGKIGIRGRVVSRMGSVVARVALAGFISGVGKGMQDSTMTQTLSAAGVARTPDPSKTGLSGIGSGIGAAADELSKFYLRLAEATLPVIEVGSNRKITMVIQEGTDLEIKPLGAPSLK